MLTLHFSRALKWSIILVFAALIVFLPSLHFMPNYLTYHDGHRLLMLLLLTLTMLYFLFNSQSFGNQFKIDSKVRYAFFGLLFLACISSYLSKAPRHAMIEMSIFTGLTYFAMFVAELYQKQSTAFTNKLIFALWVGVLLYLFAFYVGYITACIFKTPVAWPKPLLGFNNTRFFNQYQLWSIGLICLPILASDVSANTKRWLSVALTLWWVLLFYSASRGVILAWFVASIFTFLIYKKLSYPLLRLQIISLLSGLLSFFVLFKLIPILIGSKVVTGSVIRETTSDRIELWIKAFQLTLENPVFGVGPMNFPWYNLTLFHPHNSILQLSSEWGLPGIIIILGGVSYAIKCWLNKFNAIQLKNKSEFDSNLSIILLFTILTNGLYSLVDGVIVMPMSQVLMFTVIGLMIGQYLTHSGNQNVLQNKISFRQMFTGVVIVSLLLSNFPEVKQGLSGYELGFSTGPGKVNPRTWINIRTTSG